MDYIIIQDLFSAMLRVLKTCNLNTKMLNI